MALYSNSNNLEVLILKLRKGLVESKGSIAKAAGAAGLNLADARDIIREHNRIFSDLLREDLKPNTGLLSQMSESAEVESITRALNICGDNVALTAKVLGVSRTTLHQKISKFLPNRKGLIASDITGSESNS